MSQCKNILLFFYYIKLILLLKLDNLAKDY